MCLRYSEALSAPAERAFALASAAYGHIHDTYAHLTAPGNSIKVYRRFVNTRVLSTYRLIIYHICIDIHLQQGLCLCFEANLGQVSAPRPCLGSISRRYLRVFLYKSNWCYDACLYMAASLMALAQPHATTHLVDTRHFARSPQG